MLTAKLKARGFKKQWMFYAKSASKATAEKFAIAKG
jgi:hypothetical protein